MKIKRSEEIALLRLEAGKANAIGPEFLESLDRLLDQLVESDARAAVITGYDRFFSAGLALPTLIDYDPPRLSQFIGEFARVMWRVFSLPLPVVAAINGHAIAGGCVLALQADRRLIANQPLKIGLNEVQLGIGLPASVIEPLKLQLPPISWPRVALEGELFDPEQALKLGLVDEVVPPEQLEQRALELATRLAAINGPAYAQVKLALREPTIRSLGRRLYDNGPWVQSWFTQRAQASIRQAVEQLGGGKA